MAGAKFGELLVKQGVVRPDQMSKALEEQKKTGGKIGVVLVQMGIVKDAQILKALEQTFQIPGIDLNNFPVQAAATQLVPRDVCEKHGLIPVQKVGATTLVVAFSDPGNMSVRDDLRFISRCKIQAVVATELAIQGAIDKYYGANVGALSQQVEQEQAISDQAAASGVEAIDFGTGDEEGPIVKYVNAILTDGIRRKASDIHFEPYEKRFRVRYRVDGVMMEASSQSPASSAAIASRIKIMAKLDIAEKRRPQDGRIKLRTSNREMDFRVSVMPTIWGEKVVLRLLDKSNLQLDMTKLGMEPEDLKLFKDIIHYPQGLLLITGPTGSGKTTTIYSALAELNKPDVNISTAEDPVEFNLEGINQVQMNPDIDLTFATALRSFLRQDPDIIMVGEIRDLETAEISMKAASTGHLVVSTLHTNDAPQTVARLTEMGVAPYIVTSTLNLIVAQRLVGRVCENCRQTLEVTPQTLLDIGVEPAEVNEYKLFKGRGCPSCNGTGIKGRTAIFELMEMSPNMKDAVLKNASAEALRALARKEGMRTLRRSALLKLKRGETTIEEVLNASIKDV
ncbi:MAG: type IV-A pilus assembly ATPase PilB [Bdellovibrio sp. CG10_big_fil_rev_8_21_14_0_10_47_8]|nr:MAG: type IV-A pilus assembly ATPase PilB [Bdellovibrio sp. CG10_big_fil_rev_8_21_14_0_10_47_8]